MKVLYFIVCLLLVACSGDNQPEVNQPFELKNIIVLSLIHISEPTRPY